MNNLLVYSTTSLASGHLALEKEILDRKVSSYDQVFLLSCSGQLNSCYFNRTHNPLGCSACYAKCSKHIESAYDFREIIHVQRGSKKVNLSDIVILDDLMNVTYKGVDIGRGVVSSIISIRRDASFDLIGNQDLIRILCNQSMSLLDQMEHIVDEKKITEVLLFNGRFSESYPLMAYCRLKGIDFYTHDKGSNFDKFQLIKNSTVHDLATREILMNEKWESGNLENNREVAKNWFKSKLDGTIKTEAAYTKDHERDSLPAEWRDKEHNLVIFNSSEDEFKSIKDWNHDLFSSQKDLVIRLAKRLFLMNSKVRIYLRFHPNLKGLAEEEVRELREANLSNLVVIEPESTIDSYRIMKKASKVLTFGSRMSIEAAYFGIPSIIYGKSFYHTLDCLYKPGSFEELLEFVLKEDLEVRDSDDYLKAAFFLQERGELAANTSYIDKYNTEYKGRRLRIPFFKALFSLLQNYKEFKMWRLVYNAVKNRKPHMKSLLKVN